MQRLSRRNWVAIGVAAALVAITVSGSALAISRSTSGTPSSTSSSEGAAGGIQTPDAGPSTAPQSGIVVTHVSIPDIGVSSDVELLTLNSTGALLPPVDFNKAGWYSGGVVPGQVGPAIIAGHIDSITAPAVFANLHTVTPGMKILVSLSDGRTLTFEADRSEVAPKTQFPSSAVYGTVPTPQLRVITCDGTFNPATGHYDDNLVVFATLVAK
ncbi:sortase domain-containing protein [Lacisediminihabitans sp. FW035]